MNRNIRLVIIDTPNSPKGDYVVKVQSRTLRFLWVTIYKESFCNGELSDSRTETAYMHLQRVYERINKKEDNVYSER